jgi:recombination protein RecA
MNEKEKSIAEAMKSINKKYGVNAIIKMDESKKTNIESISTGCYPLDYVFGCGGLPRGRIIEIFGAEAAGKSVLAMFIAAQAQKAGMKIVWIDAEFSFNKEFATAIGVNTDKLILSQPTTGEEGLDIVDKMASTHGVDIIILDSVASLVPQKELEGEISDQGMALQARMMSKALRIITGNVSRTNTAVIFINQLREKV